MRFGIFGVTLARSLELDMADRAIMWADRIMTMKAGMTGAVISGGLGVLEDIDWLAVAGIVVALLTALGQVVRMWTDVQRNNREARKARRDTLKDLATVRGPKRSNGQ